MEKSCETCGKAFEIKASLAYRRKHCSAACKQQANRVNLTCKCCGKTWWTWVSQTRISGRPGAGQFCSKACVALMKAKARPEPPPKRQPSEIFKVCEVCDSTFRVYPSRKDTARFCSRACQGQSAAFVAECSERQQGEKSWRWAGGKYKRHEGYVRLKANVNGAQRLRFEHTQVIIDWMLEEAPDHPFLVVIDGRQRLHPDIDVHHIDRVRSNNARVNLLAVTKPAHALIHHKGRKPEPWECWPTNPTKW
jgi:hypothetical protein